MKDTREIKEQICEIGRRMYNRNMVAANDGNISVRLDAHTILCTPTGVSKGFMTPEMLCIIDENGKLLESNDDYRPSSEMKMHLRVYEKRPDVGAIVHAHPVYATSFAIAGLPLTAPITTEAVVALGGVPTAPYGTPSTEEVPDAIDPYLPYYDAILLESHGALTYSDTLTNAYMKMESVEFYAQLLYQATQLGGPKILDKDTVEKLYAIRRQMDAPGRHPAINPVPENIF